MTDVWYPGMSLEDSEKIIIQRALQYFSWNKTKTAQSLGIAIRTLDNKLEKYAAEEAAREPKDQTRIPVEAGGLQATGQNGPQAQGIQRLEPSAEVPAKQAVSMRKR